MLRLARQGEKALKQSILWVRTLVLLPLLAVFVSSCTGKPEGVEPIRSFDIGRYLGQWFEIARLDHSFERGLTNVTATYSLRPDGAVGVLNRGFDRKNCRWKEVQGRAAFQGPSDTASLSVTFFWPFSGGYHVFALDRENYGWVMISGPSRDYLWILARRPDLDVGTRERLVDQARALGFPVDRLIIVDHGAAICVSGDRP